MNNSKGNLLFETVEVSEFGPPAEPGVYAVCVRDTLKSEEKIVYIGSSKNMWRRLQYSGHWYNILLTKLHGKFVYTKTIITDDYENLEIQLIQAYQPILNYRHKTRNELIDSL